MGGDHGPPEIVPAALASLAKYPELSLALVGREEVLRAELARHTGAARERVQIVAADEVVEMHEPPSQALKNKKQSSMRIAIEQVREGRAAACVSAGNTGALMATARFILKMLPGIDRPAICTAIPGKRGHTHVLDLGANVDSTSEQLFQFAIMGAQLASAVDHKANPSIALLNVGEEEIKGNDRVKQAAALLANSNLNYIGYVEGTDLYSGEIDVIVCDGFVGNIALKTSEGLADFLRHHAVAAFKGTLYARFAALVARPVLKALRQKIDPRRYNGASLLGLRGTVIKSHGSADRVSFATAIEEAMLEVEQNIAGRIGAKLEQFLMDRQEA